MTNAVHPPEATRRKPPWLTAKALSPEDWGRMKQLLDSCSLETVCQEAHCPNIGACFHAGRATFLVMGRLCTRQCRFCAVQHGPPADLDPSEPERLATAVQRLGLHHTVITSVTRDDLADGGSKHLSACIQAIHHHTGSTVEALVPDFQGSEPSLAMVLDGGPEVLGHNVETVPRIYRTLRPAADYHRSLLLLRRAKELRPNVLTKSGLMVGVGENEDEVIAVLQDLIGVRCDLVTIGQYLPPSSHHHPVAEYVRPEVFKLYGEVAQRLGFRGVASGPLVRSSFAADSLYRALPEVALANRGSQTW